jgi:pyruvate kinase
MNKTKIIATITDAYTEEKLIAISQAGTNIVRLNFSHAKQENIQPLIHLIHKLNQEGKTNLGILLDTKGPEVRTGERTEPYHYKQGERFKIFIEKEKMSQNSDMFCDYANLLEEIHV